MKPDPLTVCAQLAKHAGEESPPGTDVVDRVLATLRSPVKRRFDNETAYTMFGVGSCVAACIAAAMFVVITGNDSHMMLAEPFFTVLP